MSKIRFAIVSLFLLTLNCSQALACEGNKHDNCLSETHYNTIEECDQALEKDKRDFHAWLDRGVLKAQQGLDDAAAADFDQATAILDQNTAIKISHK